MNDSAPDTPQDPVVHSSGDIVTVELGEMVHGGVCLALFEDGARLFVEGGIPGETARVELRYRKRKIWFGTVVDTPVTSPHRVVAPCPYVGTCGGCQLQHIDYAHQVQLKRDIVADAMRRQHVTLPEATRLHPMDAPWRYRWRGEFHVVPGRDGIADAGLGFNRVRSWRPVAVEDCLIHHETIGAALPALREMVRGSADERLTTLHVTVGEAGKELLIRGKPAAALDGAVVDAVTHSHDGLRIAREHTTLHWRDNVFRITPESFIQVNWRHLDVLYGIVLDRLGDVSGQRIVDAYAGIGVMSCVIAHDAAEVVCIENNPSACHMGRLNARVNEVSDRITYVVAPVEEALPGVCALPVDALIIDPPRSGCESAATGFIALAGPERVVYISCDPATMARDLRVLVASGPYEIETFDIVDMFPHTYHVECVASLRRRP